MQEAARHLLPVLATRMLEAPYAVMGHSMGSWLAAELAWAAADAGRPCLLCTESSRTPPVLKVYNEMLQKLYLGALSNTTRSG
jgi:surfactin synthase thioesterase subunit